MFNSRNNNQFVSKFTSLFLQEFYSNQQMNNVMLDNMLNRHVLTPDIESINNFLNDVGDVVFTYKKDKVTDFFNIYCGYVRSLKYIEEYSSKIESLYHDSRFEVIEERIIKLSQELDDLLEQRITKKVEYAEKFKIKQENYVNKGIEAAIQAKNREIKKSQDEQISLMYSKNIPSEIQLLIDAQRRCNLATEKESVTSYNMWIGSEDSSEYAPGITTNINYFKHIITKYNNQDNKISVSQEELLKCKKQAKYKIILNMKDDINEGNDAEKWEIITGISEKHNQKNELKAYASNQNLSCISFDEIFKINIKHKWLEPNIYKLINKLSLEKYNPISKGNVIIIPDEFSLLDHCKIPNGIIIGYNAMFSSASSENVKNFKNSMNSEGFQGGLFSFIKRSYTGSGEIQYKDNQEEEKKDSTNTAEKTYIIDDSFVILGYEYTDLCAKPSSYHWEEL